MEASSWDALRKQARRLEAQLDDQMIAYRKLVSMKSDGSENDIETDIERSLKQLQQVNSQMQTWVSSGGSEVLSHTLTRHMEILQDLTQEFYRLRSSLRVKQQHASLLDLRDFDRAKFDVEESGDSEQALLREQAAISRNSGQVGLSWLLGAPVLFYDICISLLLVLLYNTYKAYKRTQDNSLHAWMELHSVTNMNSQAFRIEGASLTFLVRR